MANTIAKRTSSCVVTRDVGIITTRGMITVIVGVGTVAIVTPLMTGKTQIQNATSSCVGRTTTVVNTWETAHTGWSIVRAYMRELLKLTF
jgi:hypothetical protein